ADFTTDVDLSAIPRNAWVMRAHFFSTYHDRSRFSGLSFGMGGDFAARLYDKTLEIQKSGKEYLFPLWKAAGWDGNQPVWRLEFQVRRTVLGEMGLRTVPELLANRAGL